MIKNYPSIRRTLCFLAASISSLLLSAQRVLYIGDSVTDGGWGRSGGSALPSEKRNHSDQNHVYGHSYMMLCAAHYQSLYPYGNLEFFNRGISGNTLTDLEQRWEQDVLALKPDVLSILIGTNDVGEYLKKPEADFDLQNWDLCLNVSPRSDGTIPEDQQQILLKIGEWLQTYGEGIYGKHSHSRRI